MPTIPQSYHDGIADTDLLIYVNADQEECGEGTLAYASHCVQDSSTDRPVVGYIQMCPDSHQVKTVAGERDEDFHTAVHEILHIMGWSNSLFPFFRDASGRPRTPRCPMTQGNSGVLVDGMSVEGKEVIWYKGESGENGVSYTSNQYCCASNTLGQPPFECSASSLIYLDNTVLVETKTGLDRVDSKRTAVKSPKVVEVARKHFACDTLDGVELEDDGGGGTAGSHWEKRQMMNEFMCGAPSGFKNSKSAVTLALLEDSGWYLPDYSQADALTWGWRKGCSFATACSTFSSTGWCNALGQYACTFDRSGLGNCTNLGSNMEGCPFRSPFQNTRCDEFFGVYTPTQCGSTACTGEVRGASSACFESTLFQEGYTSASARGVGCYEYECVDTGKKSSLGDELYHLKIKDPSGVWRTCTNAQTFTGITGYTGTLSCPDDWQAFCSKPDVVTNSAPVIAVAGKNSAHYVKITLTMPYTVQELDDENVRVPFITAIARAAGTIKENIHLDYPNQRRTMRRQSASTVVEVKIVSDSADGIAAIKTQLGSTDRDVLAKINTELRAEKLQEATDAVVKYSDDDKGEEPSLSGGQHFRSMWRGGDLSVVYGCVHVVCVSLLVASVHM
eukprot:Tamp_07084.p1 GENE.Tamp_07084~~Tamp_07084.p1  ORF type:complete len:618 (+),score=81.29 Tamp_07084:601-2454(+)